MARKNNDFLRIQEAADYLGINYRSMRNIIKDGRIALSVSPSGQKVITYLELEKYKLRSRETRKKTGQ